MPRGLSREVASDSTATREPSGDSTAPRSSGSRVSSSMVCGAGVAAARPARARIGTAAEATTTVRREIISDTPTPAQVEGRRAIPSSGRQSIDGMTRSGGRWPSMKVLMLTMTFSPMSMRPSTVAEPMWGSSTTLGSFSSLGLMAGSCS